MTTPEPPAGGRSAAECLLDHHAPAAAVEPEERGTPPCGHRSGIHDEHCDVINDPGGDELDEALTGAMSAIEWAANHISLLRTQLAELQEQHDNAMAALDALPSSKGEFAEIIAPLAEWGPPTGPDSVRRRTAEDIAYRAYVLGKRQASDGWDEAQNEAKRLEAALATAERERDEARRLVKTLDLMLDDTVGRWPGERTAAAMDRLSRQYREALAELKQLRPLRAALRQAEQSEQERDEAQNALNDLSVVISEATGRLADRLRALGSTPDTGSTHDQPA